MLDLGYVRANLPVVEEKLRARGADPAVVLGDFVAIEQNRRDAITRKEQALAKRKEISARFGWAKQTGPDRAELMDSALAFAKAAQAEIELIPRLEEDAATAEERLREIMQTIPNLPQDSVPIGPDERSNRVEKTWDGSEKQTGYTPPIFNFPALPHWEIGERLGILDFERAAKISGARFVVHYGQGARLERALANFMLDLHTREHGYTEVLPPFLVNSKSMFGTGQLPKFEKDMFKVESSGLEQDPNRTPQIGEPVFVPGHEGFFEVKHLNGSDVDVELFVPEESRYQLTVPKSSLLYLRTLYLIPTAEVPVTNLFRDETLDESQLTTSFCAYTPCFRSEAGSYGKDVRGMIRQHQFQKVELVKFCRPEDSNAEHERLTRDAEAVLERLGLPYRRMLLSTGDMGFASAKTYDLEVWLPGQNLYREISSCSNFEAFQARRANIRFRPSGAAQGKAKKSEFVHTLNGSGLAVGRTYLAVLENYQQADGTVRIPEALLPYMNDPGKPRAEWETGIAPRKHTGRS